MPEKRVTFLIALSLGVFVWITDALIDHLFFFKRLSFLDSLLLNVPAHEVYMRLFSLVGFIAFGIVFMGYASQHRKTRQVLRESEEKFKGFAEQSLVGFYHIAGEVFTYVNPKFAEIFGYAVGECLDNMPFEKLVHPADLAMVRAQVQKRAAGEGKTAQYTFRGVRKNGETITAEIFGASFSSNGLTTVTGTILDITKRRQTEAALRQSEAFTRATLDNLPVGIAINSVDPTVKFEYMNDNFPRYYRTSRKALADPNVFWDAVYEDPEFRQEIKKKVLDDCACGIPERMHWIDVPITRQGQETRFVTARNIPIPDKQLAISTVWDVTERKRAEDNLRNQQSVLNKAQEIGHIGSWELDIQNNELIWTDETYRIFGLPIGEKLSYETFLGCVHPEDREYVDSKWKAAFNKEPYDIEHRLLIKDKVKWVREKAELEFDDKDECVRGTGFAQDITERKLAEQALQESEESLRQSQKIESIGTLAGGIAHDFNNIIGIILGNTELALDDIPEWNPAHLNLKEVRTASLRAKDVVHQLLSFARKTNLTKTPINVAPIIKESLKLMRSSIPASIEIRQNISSDIDTILADPTQINQVLINLCTNADHAMPDGGVMVVTLHNFELNEATAARHPGLSPGSYVNLTASDTGHGISKDVLDRIFDPYYTTKDVGRGTGMGLAVVHGIVRGHRGIITVESEPGVGTTFSIFFPVVQNKAQVQTEPEEKIPTGNERLLLIDDEEAIANFGSQILERMGYTVQAMTNPVEALSLLQAHPENFDLVITDQTMPQMTGDKLVKAIRDIQPEIPVILCTGYSEKLDKRAALEIGAAGYLEKPIGKRDFASIVRNVLDMKKTRV